MLISPVCFRYLFWEKMLSWIFQVEVAYSFDSNGNHEWVRFVNMSFFSNFESNHALAQSLTELFDLKGKNQSIWLDSGAWGFSMAGATNYKLLRAKLNRKKSELKFHKSSTVTTSFITIALSSTHAMRIEWQIPNVRLCQQNIMLNWVWHIHSGK